jgi:farnesyl diphosphate synthase
MSARDAVAVASETHREGQGVAFKLWLAQLQEQVELALSHLVSAEAPGGLGAAMRYAVLDGGKRLRPALVMGTFDAFAHELDLRDLALRSACAVEVIHSYSLVHDDMPCMDDDVLRRGKPTVHVKFGEAQALLAGDALQALAFELIAPDIEVSQSRASHAQARLCAVLARASGHAGMAGGQAIDLASVGARLSEVQLQHMHALKTGALLAASVAMGAVCAEASAEQRASLDRYGQALGLAFQVVDDILDVTADSAVLGKTAGKDAAQDKPTYVSVLGMDAARARAKQLHEEALDALAQAKAAHPQRLIDIADWVIGRTF